MKRKEQRCPDHVRTPLLFVIIIALRTVDFKKKFAEMCVCKRILFVDIEGEVF